MANPRYSVNLTFTEADYKALAKAAENYDYSSVPGLIRVLIAEYLNKKEKTA